MYLYIQIGYERSCGQGYGEGTANAHTHKMLHWPNLASIRFGARPGIPRRG